MKKLSFIITLLGILILLVIMQFSSSIQVNSPSELENLIDNQKLVVSGKVIEEKIYEKSKTLILDNKIEVVCNNCPSYFNKNIIVSGISDNYNNKNKIIALKIKLLE